MRALAITRYGGPDVLTLIDRDVRAPGPDDVVIRVAAATVNPTDIAARAGLYTPGSDAPDEPLTPGMDAAGVVEAVGSAVTRIMVGQEVMATVLPDRPEGGAQAERIVVPAASVVAIPTGATLAEAATLPMNGMTALEALDLLAIPEGGTLAITGGAGWMATLTIALARERGLRVIADARPDEHEPVRASGADAVVDRGPGVAQRIREHAPEGVDGLLDTALLGPEIFPAIRDGGGWAVVRGQRDETERGIVRRPIWVSRRLEDTAALELLQRLASAGRLPMRVAATFPLEQAADAHRQQEAGGVRGRLVLTL